MLIQNSISANAHKPRFLMLPSVSNHFFYEGTLKENWEGYSAGTFYQDIDFSKINSVNVNRARRLVRNCYSFNQDISNWDVSNIKDFLAFFLSTNFNQDIGNWDTSSATNMSYMFYNTPFNQDISWSSANPNQWRVNNATNFGKFLTNNTDFSNANYDKFLIGLKAQDDAGYTLEEGVQLDAPNQQYGADPDAVTAHDFLTTTRGWTINDAGQVV